MKTAVEWLINELDLDNDSYHMKRINQAKEMEKQQIIDFAVWFNNRDNSYKSYTEIVEQYYNETFNK